MPISPTPINTTAQHRLLAGEPATQRLAQALARAATALLGSPQQLSGVGLSLYLQGGLGAGKTTFVRHLLAQLGVTGRIKSPTYGLAESYEITVMTQMFTVWHFDFYRLESDKEFTEAGFAELWSAPVLRLVEWPEHAAPSLPPPDVTLTLNNDDADQHTRHAYLQAHSSVGQSWLELQHD